MQKKPPQTTYIFLASFQINQVYFEGKKKKKHEEAV